MGPKVPTGQNVSRVDTLEIKSTIEKKLGHSKSGKYFILLTKYISRKISKSEFDRDCIGAIGRENLHLHNYLIKSIMKNACLSVPPPPPKKLNGPLRVKGPNGLKDFPLPHHKGRAPGIRSRKTMDRFSPLGPHGKSHKSPDTEFISLRSRPPVSVESGEEVDQRTGSPSIQSKSPVALTPPLGVNLNNKEMRKVQSSYNTNTCHVHGELPNTSYLKKRLEEKLVKEGLNISVDCANLLNNSISVYLKRLMKPCLELAASRSATHGLNGTWPVRDIGKSNGSSSVSMLDFKTAMELNPSILGKDWPMQLEKICLREPEVWY